MAAKMLDFTLSTHHIATYVNGRLTWTVPEHDREPLENYFFEGWSPGGYLTALLANDAMRATGCADAENKKHMWSVLYWIVTAAPKGSYGDYASVEAWSNDVDGRRTEWADKIKKKFMWDTLSK